MDVFIYSPWAAFIVYWVLGGLFVITCAVTIVYGGYLLHKRSKK